MNFRSKWVMAAIALMILAPPLWGQTVAVGTFDRNSVIVAFYRSPVWGETMKQKRAEQEAAKKASDTKKVEELEHWGSSSQQTAHKQLAGEAGIGNIVEALQPGFREIAAKKHLSVIVAEVPYAESTVKTLDVTDELLDWLKADAQTRKMIADMRAAKAPPAR